MVRETPISRALRTHDKSIMDAIRQRVGLRPFVFSGANVMPFYAVLRTLPKWFGWNRQPWQHRMYRCLWRRLQKGC